MAAQPLAARGLLEIPEESISVAREQAEKRSEKPLCPEAG